MYSRPRVAKLGNSRRTRARVIPSATGPSRPWRIRPEPRVQARSWRTTGGGAHKLGPPDCDAAHVPSTAAPIVGFVFAEIVPHVSSRRQPASSPIPHMSEDRVNRHPPTFCSAGLASPHHPISSVAVPRNAGIDWTRCTATVGDGPSAPTTCASVRYQSGGFPATPGTPDIHATSSCPESPAAMWVSTLPGSLVGAIVSARDQWLRSAGAHLTFTAAPVKSGNGFGDSG
jgi:hypothetical protein